MPTRFFRRETMSWARLIVAATATSVAVAACGGSSSSSSGKQATSTISAGSHALPAGQLGTYVRSGGSSGDTSALKLTADGRYTQTLAGGPVINGTWSFGEGKITFTETGGSGATCIGRPGSYRWSYVARKLTLRAISEPCQPRGGDFSLGPFTQRS